MIYKNSTINWLNIFQIITVTSVRCASTLLLSLTGLLSKQRLSPWFVTTIFIALLIETFMCGCVVSVGALPLPSDPWPPVTDLAGSSVDVALAEELLHNMHFLGRLHCGQRGQHDRCVSRLVLLVHVTHIWNTHTHPVESTAVAWGTISSVWVVSLVCDDCDWLVTVAACQSATH